MSEVPVIAIDGPSGSGKGTIARIISERLGWNLLDSGAIYRLLALSAIRNNIDLSDEDRLSGQALNLDVKFESGEDGETKIFLENDDVTREIRTEKCGTVASKIAPVSSVRNALLQRQRDFAMPPGLVADGRDMGTIVFPEAKTKVFLTASAEERAKRRYKQLKQNEFNVNLAALVKEIEERDYRDTNREIAPLRPAEGAVVVDSSTLTIDEVVEKIMQLTDSI